MGGGFILRDRNLFVALRCGRGRFVAFQPNEPMKTITDPKRLRADLAESFRLEIIAIGGRWNNSYNYGMIPEGQEIAADEIRARYPDREFEKAPNQFCLDRR